jgi:transcriptional repressor NrdR
MVMESLGGLDPVAYVRYASVYRDFKTPADFARFIETAIDPEIAAEPISEDAETAEKA